MSQQKRKATYRKKTSYLPSIISISLVLFMLGLFGILILEAQKLSNHIKENFQVDVFLKKDIAEAQIFRFQKKLEVADYVKQVTYVSKEEAAKTFAKEMGHDFVDFLGYNPLLPSFEILLKAPYTLEDSVANIDKALTENNLVKEVSYQKSILEQVNSNIKLIGSVLLGLSAIFLLIAITLINNTIRLNLFARRFIIKSMQLVGATRWFIIRPFMWKSILHGFYGGVIACGLLAGLLYLLPNWMPEIEELYNQQEFAIVFAAIFVLGLFITSISSIWATRRYLRLKLDDLY